MWRELSYRFEALIAATAFLSLLVINSGHYMWWGGWTFGPRHLIHMLPFLGLPLVFIPRRWFAGVVILSLISIFQMFIVVSSKILTPGTIYRQLDKFGYFAYSSIYSYCLPRLLDGKFAANLGHGLFGLDAWLSLVPLLLVILIISAFVLARRDHSGSAI